jgi:8-oxo-dGTP pyrophosphatase MutT (NUDIX family)
MFDDPIFYSLPALEAQIEAALAAPLPGEDAQSVMAPSPRPTLEWNLENARTAAALLVLYPLLDRPHVLLTLRSHDLPSHRGQVSLPGGMVEPGESPVAAALREAHEEVGLDPTAVEVLCDLTPVFIPVTGFILHPFVAVARRALTFTPHEAEVARVLEVPLADLADPARQRAESRMIAGEPRRVPYFLVDGEKLWGATAMILAEFMTLLGFPPIAMGEPSPTAAD